MIKTSSVKFNDSSLPILQYIYIYIYHLFAQHNILTIKYVVHARSCEKANLISSIAGLIISQIFFDKQICQKPSKTIQQPLWQYELSNHIRANGFSPRKKNLIELFSTNDLNS